MMIQQVRPSSLCKLSCCPWPGQGSPGAITRMFGVLHRVFVLPRGKKLLLPTARHQPHCTSPRQGEPGLLATFKDKFSSSCKLLVSSAHLAEIRLLAKHTETARPRPASLKEKALRVFWPG